MADDEPRILLFDIDGTLVATGGAGAVAWKLAFQELHGIPADIGQFTDAGMTDPEVGANTFEAVLDRKPTPHELAQIIQRRLEHLPETVAASKGYTVREAVERARAIANRHIPADEMSVIGDTPLDIEAAHRVGCRAIAVATGHYDRAALAEAGADHVLDTLEEELPIY